MSRLISLLQKFNFIDDQITDPDSNDNVAVLTTQDTLPSNCCFVTPRILVTPFPTPELQEHIAGYLNTHFGRRYMVWNLGEHVYDTEMFNSQVLEFVFVGYPNPPLEAIFGVCNSMKGWLETDPDNIVVAHCQGNRSRSLMIVSCFLAWYTSDYPSPHLAFCEVAKNLKLSVDILFPSQNRYLEYFSRVINGEKPVSKKLYLERVILDGIPVMEEEGPVVRPYFQIFKGPNMIYSSASQGPVLSYYESDMSISFEVGMEIEGDVLIRCRHISKDNKRITLFRCMFNTAFAHDFNLRLAKEQLDFASGDSRFPDDFMMDLFFSSSQRVSEEAAEQLWNSVVRRPASEDEEEEKLDVELMEKYKHRLEDSEGEEDDLSDYFEQLEAKTK